MESQFQPTVRSVYYLRRQSKLHAAEAGGLSFDPLLEVVRLKLKLHATKVGGLSFDPLLEVVRLKLKLHATKVGGLFSE
jgi:hypothetical protein